MLTQSMDVDEHQPTVEEFKAIMNGITLKDVQQAAKQYIDVPYLFFNARTN